MGVLEIGDLRVATVHAKNECTKVQNPRRPHVCESLKAQALDVYNARAQMLERHVQLKLKVGSVHCWKRYNFDRSSTHACTPSCSNRWYFAVHRTGIPDCG